MSRGIYLAREVLAMDSAAIAEGADPCGLMENAGEALLRAAESLVGALFGKKTTVFCGSGKNGGDGICVARRFLEEGAEVVCFITGERQKFAPETAEMERRLIVAGGKLTDFAENIEKAKACCETADLIIDAVFGVGFRGDLSSAPLKAAKIINAATAAAAVPVLSADIPSGAEADSGYVSENCVRADMTVTFTAPKPAHYLQPAKSYVGKLVTADIGIPRSIAARFSPSAIIADAELLDAAIPRRAADTHKGSYGKLLIVAGSVGYTGAPFLSSEAALRSGAGLVYLAVPEEIYGVTAQRCVETICVPLPSKNGQLCTLSAPEIDRLLEICGVGLIGPGLGGGAASEEVLRIVRQAKIPLVIDADGINALAGNIDILRNRSANTVLTPHDREFERLAEGLPGCDIKKDGRLAAAKALASVAGCIVVLKGNTTVTASPDGRAYISENGNPGMAKGGSGDLLAGIIASLIAQGLEIFTASACGVLCHALAGDACAAELGEYGMLPRDMLLRIPGVLKRFNSRKY